VTSPASPEPTRGPTAPPSEAELRLVARPATVRRAPRFRAFIVVGALIGIAIGALLGAIGPTGLLQNRTPSVVISAIGLGGFGALAGAGLAVWSDSRSTARRPKP
jgi:hypothetical protein